MRTFLLILLLSGLVWAQPETPASLDLTPEQTATLKSIRDRFEERRQDVTVRLKTKRLELATLLRQDEVDKATVKAKLDEILQLEGERQTLFLNEMFEAKAQLKPGQWRTYRRQIFRSLMGEKRGR